MSKFSRQTTVLLVTAIASVIPGTALGEGAGPITFTKDVAPILQEKCQQCHRPGEMAPMSLRRPRRCARGRGRSRTRSPNGRCRRGSSTRRIGIQNSRTTAP